MRIIRITIAVLALLGVSAKTLKNHILNQSNGACQGGKGGTCPAGYHCNEFGFCVAGYGNDRPNQACNGGKGGTCPACYKCNEFGFCIADCEVMPGQDQPN